MAVIEQEAPAIREEHRRSPMKWALEALGILALVALVVSAVMLARSPAPVVGPHEPAAVAGAGSLYTQEEQAILRLVNKGYLPAETLNGEPFRTKELVNEGLIPPAALAPWSPSVAPLYTARERAIMAAVASGQIPPQVLDGEPFRTKRLINQGLIPRGAGN